MNEDDERMLLNHPIMDQDDMPEMVEGVVILSKMRLS